MDPKEVLLRITAKLGQRAREGLELYVPQPHQEKVHRSVVARLLIRGGNQSGKTLNGAVRFADCVTGRRRYLDRPLRDGMRFLAVSLDFTLLADNIYRKLFEPGAYDVCTKCGTVKHLCEAGGQCGEPGWDAWLLRCEEAPPLIPRRFLARGGTTKDNQIIPKDGVAWRDKGRNIPERVYLRIPMEGRKPALVVIDFKSTDQGRTKFQGTQWDGAWFDEEATNDEGIVKEVERGLMKRRGWMQVTATPLAAGITLFQWSENAEEEQRKIDEGDMRLEDRRYEEVQLLTDQNAALDPDEVNRYFEGMGEEEERVRRTGEFLVQQGLVYREFDRDVHVCQPFQIPYEWTIYEVLDPGHANAFAIGFFAVDPHGTAWLFDELYLKRAELREVVKAWHKLLNGGSPWLGGKAHWSQATRIDPAATQEHAGMDQGSVRNQLTKLRREYNFKSYSGEHGILKANNDVQAGIFAVKAFLREREYQGLEGGQMREFKRPRLMVFSTCVHWLREVRRYRYERAPDNQDLNERGGKAGVVKKDDHMMDLTRYFALSKPRYIEPHLRPDYGGSETLRKGIAGKREKLKNRAERKFADATRCS